MYYSLTFANGERNTWEDWKLIAMEPPIIEPPAPNTNLVNIPGRLEGPLDLSTLPFGYLTYGRMSGTWNFIGEEFDSHTRVRTSEDIRKWLHGRETTVMLEDDKFHYYKGRFSVSAPKSNDTSFEISIGYNLEPRRWNIDGTVDTDFLLH